MVPTNDGLLRSLRVFTHISVLLLLTHSCEGQSNLICSSEPIVALAGEDVTLPCRLDPPISASSRAVEWTRPGLDLEYVHVRQDGRLVYQSQNPQFKYRTALFVDQLINGNVSLKLSRVKLSDAGRYRCFIPTLWKEAFLQVTVGAASSPIISVLRTESGVLQCSSVGWYPEPEVLWLDGEGNLLSAGPTETVRGPDDLYTVSSRVTVEKRHSNSFTCRVQQKDTNQMTETHITVPDDCFEAPSSSAARVSIIVVVFLILISAAAFVVWKWRRNQTKETKRADSERGEREQLIADSKKIDLEEKTAKLEESLKKNKEEQNHLESAVKTMMEQKEELQGQREKIKQLKEDTEKNAKDIDNEVQSVEKMAESKRCSELKRIVLTAKHHLRQRIQGDDYLVMTTSTALFKTNSLLNVLTERQKAAEKEKEKLKEQLEEIKEERDLIQKKLSSEQREET